MEDCSGDGGGSGVHLIVEPFYGGSHKQLVDTLAHALGERVLVCTLPAKKWKWYFTTLTAHSQRQRRLRCSAVYFAERIPHKNYGTLFCSSMLNLAELIGSSK